MIPKIKHNLRLTFVLFLLSTIATRLKAEVYTITSYSDSFGYLYEQYCDNLNEVFYINTGSLHNLKFDYNLNVEMDDYLTIYEIGNNGEETEILSISGITSGSITTTLPSGRAKVVIQSNSYISYADAPQYLLGFAIEYSQVNPVLTTTNFLGNNNVTVAGNLGIGLQQPQTKLHINGSVRGGYTTNGALSINTGNGTLTLGPQNSEYCDFNTNAYAYRFDKPVFASALASSGAISYYTNSTYYSGSSLGTPKMTLTTAGNLGIGTTSTNQRLSVKGNISVSPTTATPIENLNGSLMITKPAASGQYINLSRTGASTQWSIGTVYNTSNFAIGQANATDASFTSPQFVIKSDGKIGIGTANPQFTLDVNGIICANEVKVTLNHFADFVFDKDYNLPKLTDVSRYIDENGHLPGIPTTKQVTKDGLNMAEMQVKLLQKIEEMTLYMIEQHEQLTEQQKRINDLEQKLKANNN